MKDLSKIFNVRVTPRARQNKVVENGDVLRVYTTTVAENGRANDAVVELLSKHFDIAKSRIKIVRGQTSRDKVVAID